MKHILLHISGSWLIGVRLVHSWADLNLIASFNLNLNLKLSFQLQSQSNQSQSNQSQSNGFLFNGPLQKQRKELDYRMSFGRSIEF